MKKHLEAEARLAMQMEKKHKASWKRIAMVGKETQDSQAAKLAACTVSDPISTSRQRPHLTWKMGMGLVLRNPATSAARKLLGLDTQRLTSQSCKKEHLVSVATRMTFMEKASKNKKTKPTSYRSHRSPRLLEDRMTDLSSQGPSSKNSVSEA